RLSFYHPMLPTQPARHMCAPIRKPRTAILACKLTPCPRAGEQPHTADISTTSTPVAAARDTTRCCSPGESDKRQRGRRPLSSSMILPDQNWPACQSSVRIHFKSSAPPLLISTRHFIAPPSSA